MMLARPTAHIKMWFCYFAEHGQIMMFTTFPLQICDLEETESKRNLLNLAVDSTSYVSYSMNIISAVREVVCRVAWGSINTCTGMAYRFEV